MRKTGIFLLAVFFFMQLTTKELFAQTKNGSSVAVAAAQTVTPTATPQPTANPTIDTTQTPAPTVPVTAAPTSVTPTVQPKPTSSVQQSLVAEPTANPKPTVTPTVVLLPLRVVNSKKPPLQPISRIITAPFDVFMNALPQNYYSDQGQGLAPATNKILLAAAALSLLSGTLLLKWPAINKMRKERFSPVPKERRAFPYIVGKA